MRPCGGRLSTSGRPMADGTREINGRLWWKGDRVYSYPCTVTLNEDAVPGRSVQGSCSYCESTHYLDTKQLGKRWGLLAERKHKRVPVTESDGGDR